MRTKAEHYIPTGMALLILKRLGEIDPIPAHCKETAQAISNLRGIYTDGSMALMWLRRLVDEGYLRITGARGMLQSGAPRKLYGITQKGREFLAQQKERAGVYF